MGQWGSIYLMEEHMGQIIMAALAGAIAIIGAWGFWRVWEL